MLESSVTTELQERPSPGPYLGMAMPFFLLGCLGVVAIFTKGYPKGGWIFALCYVIAALFAAWTFGHRVVIKDGILTYRNGFYRTQSMTVPTIKKVSIGDFSYRQMGKKITVPALIVTNGETTLYIRAALFRPGLEKRIKALTHPTRTKNN